MEMLVRMVGKVRVGRVGEARPLVGVVTGGVGAGLWLAMAIAILAVKCALTEANGAMRGTLAHGTTCPDGVPTLPAPMLRRWRRR